jgi:DNA polymerase elongation subunit (family B)
MSELEGWLLDVYVQGDRAIVWVKGDDGRNLRMEDRYVPWFYAKPSGWSEEWQLLSMLYECPAVSSVRAEEKFVDISSPVRERLLRVETRGTKEFRQLVKGLEGNGLVGSLYDVDIRHVQKYLFTRLCVEPTSRVRVGRDGDRLAWMTKVDDPDRARPPPFSMLRIEPEYVLEEGGRRRRMTRLVTAHGDGVEVIEGTKKEIGYGIAQVVREADPDIIVIPRCDEVVFPMLKDAVEEAEMKMNVGSGLGPGLGRSVDAEQVKAQGSWGGRILIEDSMVGHPTELWGVAGLVERTRFSFLPIGLTSRWLSNRSIDSRNCYELIRRGYAIPKEGYFEVARDLEQVMLRDRGGISLTPISETLHHNVAAIDFDSQYPNIILRSGLSYERPMGEGEVSAEGGVGLIPLVMGPWLKRRMELKRVKKSLPKGSEERLFCEQRVDALKLMLVTQYGISGCCWNRFGNVVTFEEINRKSREAMMTAKSLIESRGYEVVYADVDSCFIKRNDATREDYEELAAEVSRITGLPMSLDKHFKFIAFPKLKGDPSSSALKRYFGVTYDGEVEARGIELRREDSPVLVREFQKRLILELMDRDTMDDVLTYGVAEAARLLQDTIRQVRSGNVDVDSLLVSRSLRKEPDEYRNRVVHLSAAMQMLGQGREVFAGDSIKFIFTDSENRNPMCRVRAEGVTGGSYDREVYSKMIGDAAGTVFRAAGLPVPKAE